MTESVDLLVIGGGAAGLAAARTGAARGAGVLLVSDSPLGGDCTWTGCVPSKALLESAARGLDWAAAVRHLRDVRSRIAATEDAEALGREGVGVRAGRARFLGPDQVEVTGPDEEVTRIQANRVVIATGSQPAVASVAGLLEAHYLTSETVFDLTAQPETLVVLGAGSLGCELAQAFARLGTTVTIVERSDRVLPREEPAVGEVVGAALARSGVRVLTSATAVSVAPTLDDGVWLGTDTGGDIAAERLLLAAGRRPVTAGLDLKAAGVRLDDAGHVLVDDRLRTTAGTVFAAGDVTGRCPYTVAADGMGRVAAANALGGRRRRRWTATGVPRVTFTDPEVAAVGMSEAEAARTVPGARVCELPMAELDRALVADRTEGFLRIVVGPSTGVRRLAGSRGGGRVLGATVVGPRAGEVVAELALAVRTGMFAGRLAEAPHAYPTWGGAVQQAMAQLFVEIGGRRARPASAAPPPVARP